MRKSLEHTYKIWVLNPRTYRTLHYRHFAAILPTLCVLNVWSNHLPSRFAAHTKVHPTTPHVTVIIQVLRAPLLLTPEVE